MSAPTNETRVRSALNGIAREEGHLYAAEIAVREAIAHSDRTYIIMLLGGLWGVREFAEALHVNSPNNVGKVAGIIPPADRVSNGTTPVWAGDDGREFAAEREKRRGRA